MRPSYHRSKSRGMRKHVQVNTDRWYGGQFPQGDIMKKAEEHREEPKPEYAGEAKKCEGLDSFMAQLKKGILVEHEHKDVKPDGMKSKVFYARIALAHLQERDDYYTQLSRMEKKGESQMGFLKEALLKRAGVFPKFFKPKVRVGADRLRKAVADPTVMKLPETPVSSGSIVSGSDYADMADKVRRTA